MIIRKIEETINKEIPKINSQLEQIEIDKADKIRLEEVNNRITNIVVSNGNGEKDTELLDARNGFSTLNDRLNTLVDGSYLINKKLLDKFILGTLNITNGSDFTESDKRIRTKDKITFDEDINIICPNEISVTYAKYDKNKNYIGYIEYSKNTKLDKNFYYILLFKFDDDRTISDISSILTFVQFTSSFIEKGDVLEEKYSIINNKVSQISIFTKNLFDKSQITSGGYYHSDGVWVESTDFVDSGLIEVEYGCDYRERASDNVWLEWTFWDSNEEFLYGLSKNLPGYITVPNDKRIKYVRFPINKNKIDKLMFVKGLDYPTQYIPFNAPPQIKLESIIEVIKDISGLQWQGKKWYAYGTSLTNTDNEGKYAKYLEKISGMIRTNKGISGGGLVASNGNIKNAIMNITDGKLEADLITLETGANDTSIPLGTIYDTGNDTYCGALNQCIRYLQANTNAQIVVLSSPNARYMVGNKSDLYTPERKFGTDNHTKYDQWKAIKEVCAINSVPYIPLGESSGLGFARMVSSDLYNVDQIHHTELGGYNLAKFIWEHLKTIPCWYKELPS